MAENEFSEVGLVRPKSLVQSDREVVYVAVSLGDSQPAIGGRGRLRNCAESLKVGWGVGWLVSLVGWLVG